MFIKIKIPPKTGEDDFANFFKETDILFKFVGWIIVVSTIKYIAEAIDSSILRGVYFYLSTQLGFLVASYVNSRIIIDPFENYTTWNNWKFIGKIVVGLIIVVPIIFYTNKFSQEISAEIVRYNKSNLNFKTDKEISPVDWPKEWMPA